MKDLGNQILKMEDTQIELLLFPECFKPLNELFQKKLNLVGNKDHLGKMVLVFYLKLSVNCKGNMIQSNFKCCFFPANIFLKMQKKIIQSNVSIFSVL